MGDRVGGLYGTSRSVAAAPVVKEPASGIRIRTVVKIVLVTCFTLVVFGIGLFLVIAMPESMSKARQSARQLHEQQTAEQAWAETWPTLGFPAFSSDPRLKVEYDRFEKRTKASAELRFSRCSIYLDASWAGDAPTAEQPPLEVFLFAFVGSLQARSVTLLVDGNPVYVDGNEVGTQTLLDIIASKETVEARIDGIDVVLSGEHRSAIRALLSRFRPQG